MYSSICILYTGEYYDEEVAGRAYDLATLNRQSISIVKWITYSVLYKVEISHNYIQKIVIFHVIFIHGWDFSQLNWPSFRFYSIVCCFNTIGRLHPWFVTFSYFYIINIVYIFLWCSRYCHKKKIKKIESEIDNLV